MWRVVPFALVAFLQDAQAQAVTLSDDDRSLVIWGVCALLYALGLMAGRR